MSNITVPGTVAGFVDAMHARDAEGVRRNLSPGFAGKANGRPLDLEGQVALAQSFFEGFPDGAFRLEATGGAGRHVIAWNFLGTHGGTYLGIPATGRLLRLDGYIIAVSDQTGITSLEWKWDTKKFMQAVMDPEIALPAPRADPTRNYGLPRFGGRDRDRRGKGDKPRGPRQGQPDQRQRPPGQQPSGEGQPPAAEGDAAAPADPNAPPQAGQPRPPGQGRRRRGRGPRGPREGQGQSGQPTEGGEGGAPADASSSASDPAPSASPSASAPDTPPPAPSSDAPGAGA